MGELDLQREINDLRARVDYLQALDPNPTLGELYGQFLGLPGLRAFWPLSAYTSANVYADQSGNGKGITAQAGATPAVYNSLIPTVAFNGGATAYLTRANEADLQITGAVTVGGWFFFTNLTNAAGLLSKTGGSANNAYWMYAPSGNVPVQFGIGNGAANIHASSAANATNGVWHFAVGRYTPSTELACFLDNQKGTLTAGVYAAINAGVDAFEIGRVFNSATGTINGNGALCFLCAAALSDTLLAYLWQRSRGMFGV